MVDPGEPGPETWASHETNPSLLHLSARAIRLTLTITPTLLVCWVLLPGEVKYELRKQIRWLPWAVRYAAWWLRQEG
jgi:hypothetical protein